VQKTKRALKTFIDEMRNNVLKLLSPFHRSETRIQAVVVLLLLALLGLEIGIDTHKTSDPSHVVVSERL